MATGGMSAPPCSRRSVAPGPPQGTPGHPRAPQGTPADPSGPQGNPGDPSGRQGYPGVPWRTSRASKSPSQKKNAAPRCATSLWSEAPPTPRRCRRGGEHGLATPGAPGAQNVIKIIVFGGFEGSRGPGGITNRRGMKKYPGGLIFVGFGWNYEGFMAIFDLR